jgi:hypothetical protein
LGYLILRSGREVALLIGGYMSRKKKIVSDPEQPKEKEMILVKDLDSLKNSLEINELNPMEKVMATNLLLSGHDFYCQYKIDCPEGWEVSGRKYFIVDFYIPSHLLVIEVDGKIHLDVDNIIRDRSKNNTLASLGYRVMRFDWDHVMGNEEKCGNIKTTDFIDELIFNIGSISEPDEASWMSGFEAGKKKVMDEKEKNV